MKLIPCQLTPQTLLVDTTDRITCRYYPIKYDDMGTVQYSRHPPRYIFILGADIRSYIKSNTPSMDQ